MITIDNIVAHEMIGLETKILKSNNSQIIGISGKIVDETKNMFTINTKNGLKQIPKVHSKWFFSLNEHRVVLEGKQLAKRSYERIVKTI